ncbi:MAG: protein kinase [Myxococcales bacterium]|nr:protein kinase [Myxococcales bacterium]MCB9708625.1 protein kinase [Myxococcales bacterium]
MTALNSNHAAPHGPGSASGFQPVRFGKYYLLERINVGGMAEIFKALYAEVTTSDRLIAVKRILPAIASDEAFIAMFIDEAEIAAQLSHANIAQVLDVGRVGESYYIALEFVSGHDLRVLFDQARKAGAPLSIPMACFLMMKVCEGLNYAHTKKTSEDQPLHLVHRDVSQQNVLISFDGEVKLIDFGVAKAAGKVSKTEAGILKGKFSYMSPEQVRGLPLDHRSDIFSAGICLYELLTNERLFVAESDFSTLEKVRNVEIMPPSTYNRRIPEELERIVLKALSKDPGDRHQTALALHDDLQSFLYTSGQSFGHDDLSAFMKECFSNDIAEENEKNARYRQAASSLRDSQAADEREGQTLSETTVPSAPTESHLSAMQGESGRSAPLPRSQPPGPIASFQSAPPPPPPGYQSQAASNHPLSAPPPPRNFLSDGEHSVTHARAWSDDDPETRIYEEGKRHSPIPPIGHAPARRHSLGAHPSPFHTKTFMPWSGTVSRMFAARSAISKRTWAIAAGCLAAALVLAYLVWPEAPASIQLTTKPADPVVLLDNQPVASVSSPFIITGLKPGETHTLEVRKTGYQPWSTTLSVNAGQALELPEVTLEPIEHTLAENPSGFVVETEPSGAKIFVDGILQAQRTPARITDLKAGSHAVRLEHPASNESWHTEIAVSPGQVLSLPMVRLKPATGAAELGSQAPTPLLKTPEAPALPLARAQERTPRPRRRRSTASDAPEETGSTSGGTGSGVLQINSTPWSQVYVDGNLVGNTPQMSLSLPQGKHQIRLVNPEFNFEKTLSVTIRANKTTKKIVSLQPDA